MNVRNCRKCGKIFNYTSGPHICPACRENMEMKYQEVKKYIRENEIASIQDIAIDCEVEVEQLNQWVREERLEFSDNSPIKISCENCGTPIRSGRYCDNCKREMANGLDRSIKKAEPVQSLKQESKSTSSKMRFLK